MNAPASVLGVPVTPEMVAAARCAVVCAKSESCGPRFGHPARVDRWASNEPALAPLLSAADETRTPRHLAVFAILGSACRACGWPIDGEHATDARGHVHPECMERYL